MQNKIIEILDYLCEKIGLAINWSEENIYPQVMEFISRYRTYEIISIAIRTAISIAVLILCICYFSKLYRGYNQASSGGKSNTMFIAYPAYVELRDIHHCFLACAVCLAMVSTIMTLVSITSMAKWIFIPEYQFYKLIADMI